ncbi:MAG: class I SAM-dependent methyltransferase [Holophagales bacterium]|nr:class I SAM-dependent methyltransferase [Holophagales bacterium]MYF97318.1 class I SAM-dependent methyltransferase [Holophagales bacterium]
MARGGVGMARPLARAVTQPGTCGPQGATVAVVLLAALAVSLPPAAAQTVDEPGTYKGRKIADVMSFRGAGWLERATRIEEENPDALIAALPLEEGMLVVDIGCGSGYHARRLAEAVGPEGTVLCNDIQPQMLRIASELADREGITNISMVLGTEDDPNLPEGEVDLMLIVDVYHEFSQPEPMLHAMREALAPDGVIALVEFRLEGRSAAHIKLDHRMSIEQVMKEWLPAGYELASRIDSLPTQHLFLFRAAR